MLLNFTLNTVFLCIVFLIARQFEKREPIEAEQSTTAVVIDWKLAGLKWVIKSLLAPITTACSIIIVNAAGGGWIHLRSDGWWFLVSSIVLFLAIDLWFYLLHRAMHQVPVLWAMHSLHHSAEALTMVTGARHFWLEEPIFTAAFPILGIIFKIPAEIVTPITLVYFLIGDGMVHLNFRVSFGRFGLVLNNPQFHRIHHSVEPKHLDKNFCKMFPLFDMIFGTAWIPGKEEFPKTGLGSGEKPTGFLDGIVWPIRHWVRRPISRVY